MSEDIDLFQIETDLRDIKESVDNLSELSSIRDTLDELKVAIGHLLDLNDSTVSLLRQIHKLLDERLQ